MSIEIGYTNSALHYIETHPDSSSFQLGKFLGEIGDDWYDYALCYVTVTGLKFIG